MRSRVLLWAKLALAGVLLYWMLATGKFDPSDLERVLLHWHWFALAQLSFLGTTILVSWRWSLLLRVQGIKRPLRSLAALTLSGVFFNQVVLGSTGGDLYRAYVLARDHAGQRDAAIVSVFADRAIGLLTMMLMVPVLALFYPALMAERLDIRSFVAVVLAALVVSLCAIGILFSRRLRALPSTRWVTARIPFRHLFLEVDAALTAYRSRAGTLAAAIGISVLIHSLVITTNILLAHALVDDFGQWSKFFLLIPVAHVTMALPINPPGALGTAEAIYAHLFAIVGFTSGATLALLQRLTYLLWSIPGAIFYVLRKAEPAGMQAANG